MDNCSVDNSTILLKYCGNCTTMEPTFTPISLSANKSYGVGKSPIGAYKTIIDMTDSMSSNYEWVMSLADERVSDWPLMRSPAPTILITIAYVLICCKGNRYLRLEGNGGRNSVMRLVLVAYNTLLIVLNAYIMIRLWEPCTIYKIQCHPGMYLQTSLCSCNARKSTAVVGCADNVPIALNRRSFLFVIFDDHQVFRPITDNQRKLQVNKTKIAGYLNVIRCFNVLYNLCIAKCIKCII